MKTVKFSWIILLLLLGIVSCETLPLEKEQYEKNIYLVNVERSDIQYTLAVPYQTESSEVFVSVACGGSLAQDRDVEVVLEIADTSVIPTYNHKHHRLEPEKNVRPLSKERFEIPSWKATLKANGETYVRVPIFVNVDGLHCDSTYAIPLTIRSVSDYKINPELSTLLLAFDYYNHYSGSYSTTGTKKTGDDAATNVFSTRNLKAVDEHSVRTFVGGITTNEKMTDTHSLLITFHEDNTVTVSGWKELVVEDLGDGIYIPEKNTFSIHYNYQDPTNQTVYTLSETFVKNIDTN